MTAIVSCRALTKTYVQGTLEVPAVRSVDLDIEPGDFATLAGPSGSGKTTLLNMIGGLDRPTSGEVSVNGVSLTRLDKNALADIRLHKIGFVFQTYSLVPVLSAEENVEFILRLLDVPVRERRARAREVLRQVGLEGMEGRRPARLSGGQQQRVAVARALGPKPAIVLADEPTGNLDTAAADGVFALLRRFNRAAGTTFLVVTHDPRLAARCDRIVELVDGRIVSDRPGPGRSPDAEAP